MGSEGGSQISEEDYLETYDDISRTLTFSKDKGGGQCREDDSSALTDSYTTAFESTATRSGGHSPATSTRSAIYSQDFTDSCSSYTSDFPSEHTVTSQQGPEHTSTSQQGPEHTSTSHQSPEHTSTSQQGPGHTSAGQEASDSLSTSRQASDSLSTSRRASDSLSTSQQGPDSLSTSSIRTAQSHSHTHSTGSSQTHSRSSVYSMYYDSESRSYDTTSADNVNVTPSGSSTFTENEGYTSDYDSLSDSTDPSLEEEEREQLLDRQLQYVLAANKAILSIDDNSRGQVNAAAGWTAPNLPPTHHVSRFIRSSLVNIDSNGNSGQNKNSPRAGGKNLQGTQGRRSGAAGRKPENKIHCFASRMEPLRIDNILSRMKQRTEELGEEIRGHEAVTRAGLPPLHNARQFVLPRKLRLQRREFVAKLDHHQATMNSVSMIGALARDLPRPTDNPEAIWSQLMTTVQRRVTEESMEPLTNDPT